MIAAALSADIFCWIFLKGGRKHGVQKTVECAVLNSQWRGAYLECLFIARNLIFPPPVKGEVMKIHPSVNPALWGATAGAVALAIIGFSWGGWVTGGSAQRSAESRASSSVVAALAPICLTQFQQKSDSVMQLAALKKVPSYEQSSFVEKAGWATMPGSTEPTAGVAKACATLIANLK